ncbi:MAG: zeta toxin family protein [Butyrivibrio sp.]|nr:zeta toxin family protein [Butyrivibrio sp.]
MSFCRATHINADDIKKSSLCTDMEAAIKAEELREKALSDKIDFTFETVLSTDRNLNLLKRAKENGYFIRVIYVLTASSEINIARVKVRESSGGHRVPCELPVFLHLYLSNPIFSEIFIHTAAMFIRCSYA